MAKSKPKQTHQPTLKLLLFIFKLFYQQNRLLFTAILIVEVLMLFAPRFEAYISGRLIDQAVNFISTGIKITEFSFIWSLLMLILVQIISKLIDVISAYLDTQLNNLIPIYLDNILVPKYLAMNPQKYEDPGYIQQRSKFDRNSYRVNRALYNSVYSVSGILTLSSLVVLITQYDYRIPIFIVLSIIPNTIQQLVFGQRVWNIWNSKGDTKVKYSAYQSPLYTNNHENFQEMKILGFGHYLLNKANRFNLLFIREIIKNENKRLIFTTFSSVVEYALLGVAYFFIFNLLFQSSISVGTFFFIHSLMIGTRELLKHTTYSAVAIQADVDILQTFYDLTHVENKIASGTTKLVTGQPISIKFKNVWFKYPNTNNWIFRGLNLEIDMDTDTALVGKNGAGKTTLIKLLLRIYDPDKGEILINDINLKQIDLDQYYKQVGLLSQNFNLLRITAAENIYIGNTQKKFSNRDLRAAAVKAEADQFIQQYPLKYKTYLSREIENGIQPSSGQMQRIAIARIFFREPNLIILDEPTSAIDAIAEKQIFENIYKYAQNRTILIVSHRFSTVKIAKHIVVLDKGKIIEQGTHEELMENAKLYADMYTKQVG